MNAPLLPSPLDSNLPVEFRPVAGRGGWERRLRKDVERALPWLEAALGVVLGRWRGLLAAATSSGTPAALCGLCGRPGGHSAHEPMGECPGAWGALAGALEAGAAVSEVRRAVAAGGAMYEARPADPHRVLEAQHARLLSVMVEEGLDVDLACSKLALPRALVRDRMRNDSFFAEQVRQAHDRGTITLLETLVKAARGLPVPRLAVQAATRLLEVRDPKRFAVVQRSELTVKEIVGSRAFLEEIAPALPRLFQEAAREVPEGVSAEERRGWLAAVAHLRRRAAEVFGGG